MLGRVFLGRYETIRLLGEGGMGRVYLAYQRDLGRQVVVKVMHDHVAADPLFRDRFTREMLLMARFQHPHAVTLYDASLNDPQGPCIVMEYIQGETLDAIVQKTSRLPPERVARLLRQLCEALYAAHALGIVHRDLKPGNLMITDPGTPYEHLKVMDFGLAKLVSGELMAKLTATNADYTTGTPGYMCPEQAQGITMDHRGDLYSVGIILFELLTGQLPFAGRSTMDMLLAHVTEEPPSFVEIGVAGVVPRSIEGVVQQCLAKNPEQRPSHARELADRFETALLGSTGERHLPVVRPSAQAQGPAPRVLVPRSSAPGTERRPEHTVPVPATPPSIAPAAVPPVNGAPANLPSSNQWVAANPTHDPSVLAYHVEAWMPEKIATYKLRGFIHDVGGEVLENVPGKIKVRLGGRYCVYTVPGGALSWLLGRRQIDMELRLQRSDGRDNQLRITVLLRPSSGDVSLLTDVNWCQVCAQIFIDLRAYLMGQTGIVNGDAHT